MKPNELHVFMPPETTAAELRNMIYWRCDEGNWSAKAPGDSEFVIAVYTKEEFKQLQERQK